MAGSTQQVPRTTLNPQENTIGPTTGEPNVSTRNLVWHGPRDDRYAAALQPFPLHYSSTSSTVVIPMHTAQQAATRQRQSQSKSTGHITRRRPASKSKMS